MKDSCIKYIICLMPLIWWGCREVYDPEIEQEDLEILVVEGHIEVDGGVSEIKLSYTSPVSSEETVFNPIPSAAVYIEYQSQSGEIIRLPMQSDFAGTYLLETQLNPEADYRLSIDIPEKGSYLSDWTKARITPPIDELGFIQKENSDVEIYLNTQGDETAQYFIWNFEETWIFNTPIISFLKYVKLSANKDTILYRTQNEMTNECFLSDKSKNVIIGSSGQFENQLIHQKKIQQIPNGSEKLGRRYSVLVQQRAISKEAYNFYEILRKNADDIGGIFSPLPSILGSNVYHASNPDIKAIGFITVGTSVEKRIYIGRDEVFNWFVDIPYYAGCEFSTDTVPMQFVSEAFDNNYRVPVNPIMDENDPRRILGYIGASTKCTDCTLRGRKEKPDFWEY
ncbi:DUF4249 domain-containing protein [Echinicola salinicaeni]|uniref:DUF4249 domain-containing protein n=1 Tax=Echinicola salinicaeni TaxID=2762757 RepID=UPI0016452CD8|nr:DUF4249 domain-containing protein [Echinicola salinicaeni]